MSILSLPLHRADRVERDYESFSAEELQCAYVEAARRHFRERFRQAAERGKPVFMTSLAVPDPDPEASPFYDALYHLEGGDRFELRYCGWRRIQKDQAEALVHELKPEEAAARSALERELRARAMRILESLE